jgi:hypothetical protein
MQIEGSCYCRKVTFSAVSHAPYPYIQCYCSICRKSGGAGGFAINIMAQAATLKITGDKNLAHFNATIEDEEKPGNIIRSPGNRYFCSSCGSAMWVADPRWPEWFYPHATAVDTPLPKPPEVLHIMLDFAAPWVSLPQGPGHVHLPRYPNESILDWHKRHGLYQP